MQGRRDARGLIDGSVLGVHDRGQTQVEQSIPMQIPPQKKPWLTEFLTVKAYA